MTISNKSTKAEILAAYEALQAQADSEYITWPLVVNTAKLVAREARYLAEDLAKLGAWCRKVFSQVQQERFSFFLAEHS